MDGPQVQKNQAGFLFKSLRSESVCPLLLLKIGFLLLLRSILLHLVCVLWNLHCVLHSHLTYKSKDLIFEWGIPCYKKATIILLDKRNKSTKRQKFWLRKVRLFLWQIVFSSHHRKIFPISHTYSETPILYSLSLKVGGWWLRPRWRSHVTYNASS